MAKLTENFVEALRSALIYNNGELYRQKSTKDLTVLKAISHRSLCKDGYKYAQFNGIRIATHRLIWLYHNGLYDGVIDHINGVPTDNRIENLRLSTTQENLRNRGKFKNSSSKYKGVYYRKDTNKWQASICINGKTKHLGVFLNELDAHKAWLKYAEIHHKDFLRTY